MAQNDRVNVAELAAFVRNLTEYENTALAIIGQSTQTDEPARLLQFAMQQLISASAPDAFQMMRYLTRRIREGAERLYAAATLMLLSSGSDSTLPKDEILAVPYTLVQVISGAEVNLDVLWQARVNHNDGIKLFITHYKTSDLFLTKDIGMSNVVEASSTADYETVHDARVNGIIGSVDQNFIFVANTPQIIQCQATSELEYKRDYNPELPYLIKGAITIRSNLNRFIVDRTIRFTPGVVELMKVMDCFDSPYALGGDAYIKLPASFFSIKMGLISNDRGVRWTCGSVQILPPLLSDQPALNKSYN